MVTASVETAKSQLKLIIKLQTQPEKSQRSTHSNGDQAQAKIK